MSFFVVSQILVGIAICFDLLSFQLKKRTHIVLCLSVAGIFIASHFLLLEQWTAALLMVIAVARYVTSYFSTSKNLMVLLVTGSIIGTFFTFQGFLSILRLWVKLKSSGFEQSVITTYICTKSILF